MDGDIGSVDMFGLDEFGNIVWGPYAIVGAAAGALLQGGGAVAWRRLMPGSRKWADGIGALAASAAGAVMAIFAKTRGAGVMAIGTGLAAGVPRFVESLVCEDEAVFNNLAAGAAATKMLDAAGKPTDKSYTVRQYVSMLITEHNKEASRVWQADPANTGKPYVEKAFQGVQLQPRKLGGVQLQPRKLGGAPPVHAALPGALRVQAPIPITGSSYGATVGPR